MSKFIYLYKGPGVSMGELTDEQSAEQMAAWGAWMGKVALSLTDPGAPFGSRAVVTDDGAAGEHSELNGYSIVEAENLDAAKALTEQHPFLAGGSGEYSVEIFELVDMQM